MPVVKKEELYDAVSAKDHEKLKQLLSNASLDVINQKIEYLRESVLESAAGLGDEVAVELLLAHGAIPDYKGPRPLHIWPNNTTLAWAIQGGNLKVIQLLVKHGCDPDTTFEYNKNEKFLSTCPYNYWYKVIELNNLPIFQVLLECKNRKVGNDKWSQEILLTACLFESRSIIEYLLDQGVPVDIADCNRKTPLFYMVRSTNISVIQLLIAREANIKHKDFKGRSLLHIIADQQSKNQTLQQKIIQLLIDKGAEINATDKWDETPIIFASCRVNDYIILQLLRQPGINVAMLDKSGKTFLHHTVAWCNQNVLKQILCKPNMNITDKSIWGRKLSNLINYSNLDNLSLLLEFGADTENIHMHPADTHYDDELLKIFGRIQIKRSVAGLGEDLNIDIILAQRNPLSTEEQAELISAYSSEIQRTKETILCGRLTYYNFLHANRRIYNIVTRKPGLREIFIEYKHDFKHYANILAKNYTHNVRQLTPIEIDAINSVEDNLDMIFNNQLPSLVIDTIKNNIDIEDMVALQAIRLNQTEKNVKRRKVDLE